MAWPSNIAYVTEATNAPQIVSHIQVACAVSGHEPTVAPTTKTLPEASALIEQTNSIRQPTVLVLLASYNGAKWIGEQIKSILAQRDVNPKILVRDDGSVDGTLNEISKFPEQSVRLAPISKSTGSAAQNFFTLIRENSACEFDLVAFSDQDDIWNPDKLSSAYRLLSQTGASGYSSATMARWGNGRQRVIALSGRQNTSDFLFEGAGQGCTFVLTSACYERIREFLNLHPNLTEGIHFHDWAVYALVRSWQLSWIFDPRPSMVYRQHAYNDTGARRSIRGIIKRQSLVRSGWYRQQVQKIAFLCAASAPDNSWISKWNSLIRQRHGFLRTIRSVKFCLTGGRRRKLDNIIVLIGCLAGWI